MEFPNTGYFLPISHGILGLRIDTLGGLRELVEEARRLLPPIPGEKVWMPYLGHTLDAGMATLFADEIVESIVIGQKWQNDVRVVLFVVLSDGVVLDDELQQVIRKSIRDNTTPRHVPARIVAVADIPRTISGKIVELAVRNIVPQRNQAGREAGSLDRATNPGTLPTKGALVAQRRSYTAGT